MAAQATAPALASATVPGPDVDRDLPLDAHLHTNLSPDSDVPIDVYCAAAVERGILELAITDHLDFDPRAPAHSFADFATRERTIRDAAQRWAGRGLAVRFGVEISYESRRETEIREHLAAHPYDFVIGSVHVMRGSPYTGARVAAWVAGRSFMEIVTPYFDEVVAAIRSDLFDTLGHLDYVKKYLVEHVPPTAFAAAPEAYEPVLRSLVETGTGLEVNSSGLRQAPRETYPAPWAVARFRELGGEIVTAGSDAHRARSFAYGLARAYEIAAAAGFEQLAIRRAPGTPRPAGRVLIPERLRGTPTTEAP
ncbi:MAG: histidinol-phosphatase HisJ family protein [Chloroflexota bacterium]